MGINDNNEIIPAIIQGPPARPPVTSFFKDCCTWCCCICCSIILFLFLTSLGGKRDLGRIQMEYERFENINNFSLSHTPPGGPKPSEPPKHPDRPTKTPQDRKRITCMTEPCVRVAETMKSLMKPTTSPCTDFYEHACGNFESLEAQKSLIHQERYYEESITALKTAAGFMENRIDEIALPAEINLRKVYMKCLRRDHRDVEDLMETLRTDFLWPFDDRRDLTWTGVVNHILGKLIKLSPKSLQIFKITEVDKKLIIRSSFCHGRHKAIDQTLVTKFFTSVSKDSENEVRKNLEKSLRIALELDKFREYCTERDPPKDRNREFVVDYDISNINFVAIIGSILGPNKLSDQQIESHIKFEESHEFFDENSHLNNHLHHNSIGFAHYLVIKYIEELGATFLLPSKRDCAKIAFSMMPRTALSIYINHFVQPDNIIAIPNLIDSIRSEYIDQISKSKKLDKPLKAQMIKKLEKFKTDIGSHGIGFSENNLLERVIIHNRQSFYKVITQFNTQNMQEALLSIAHDKTISENTHARSIFNQEFPVEKIYALMKTQPRFDVSYPSAVQYGKGGHDVASDMSVILKTLGKNATKSFGKCLLGHSHDANILVDFMGMKVAWDKYRKSKKPEELQLPEFDYATGDQLFFYSMIQSTCQKKTTKNTVSHGNRLNFLLQQIEGFGEAFNCPAGANMMKKKLKCEPNDDLMMI
ncbi:hypothetical protein L3Y34_019233 [Caenorhabditis briggsae]|uniref:Uncharacterized protein n=2 Tax=Caenorhabditis briggsae TaxID=6238 RepID=A0AAE9IVV4_CAEBR|nr:hypothetical protein L3Y34_019233 [Caenorhabditis briggsae]